MSEEEILKDLAIKQILKIHYAFQAELESKIKALEKLIQITDMDKAKLKHEALNSKS